MNGKQTEFENIDVIDVCRSSQFLAHVRESIKLLPLTSACFIFRSDIVAQELECNETEVPNSTTCF